MKKLIGIILALAIIAGAGFYFYQKSQEVRVAFLESIVPEDLIYYFYSYNLTEKVKASQASAFHKKIILSPLYAGYIEPLLNRFKQKLPFLSDLFAKDSALVVYSLAGAGNRLPSGYAGQSGDFLFLSRIDPKINLKIKKSIADFYLSLAAKDQVSRDQYRGAAITNYRLPKKNISIHYVLVGDVVLVSNSIGIIHKSIDLAKKQSQSSLLNNSSFQKISSRVKKDSLFWGYISNKNYYQQAMPGAKQISDWLNVLQDSVFYADYDPLKNGLVLKTYQTFNKPIESSENIFKFIYYSKSVDKDIFNLVPRNIIAYYGGTQDMVNLWKAIKKLSSAMESAMAQSLRAGSNTSTKRPPLPAFNFDNLLKKTDSLLGISIEDDFLPLLGNNFGLVFIDIGDEAIQIPAARSQSVATQVQAQSIPIVMPRIYAFMELKDSAKMQVVMDQMFQFVVAGANQKLIQQEQRRKELARADVDQQAGDAVLPLQETPKEYVKLVTEDYRQVNISSVDISDFPVASLKINYCIMDKYLIISLSKSATKKIIDIYKDKKDSLNTNFDFETAQDKTLQDYSSISFFSLKKLIDNIRLTKFFTLMRSSLPQKSSGKGFSQDSLDSALDILGDIVSALTTNRKVDDYTVESSCYIKINGI
jgi:hypothetical protein